MINKRTRFWMGAVFSALITMNLAGCDPSGIIADIIADIAQGGDGCGGCGCGGCDCACDDCACDCDCACDDCGDCVIQPIPGTFNGAHPGARIENAAQIRASSSALSFVSGQVGPLVNAVLPPIDLAAAGGSGKIYLQLRNTNITTADGVCNGNANNVVTPGNRDCVRTTTNAYFRTCDNNGAFPCAAAENASYTATGLPIIGNLTCQINADADRGADGIDVRADLAVLRETAGPRASYGRINVMDAQVTNTNQIEGPDFMVTCPDVGPYSSVTAAALAVGGAVVDGLDVSCNCPCSGLGCAACIATGWYCTLDPTGVVNNTAQELRNDINGIIDYQLASQVQFCQVATAAAQCPAGTTYIAASQTCDIPGTGDPDGGGPRIGRCMDILLGLEGRLNLGSLLASISPGLNAVVDLLFAAGGNAGSPGGGDGVAVAGGYNINFFGGLENLSHDNCVPLLGEGDPGYVARPASLPQVTPFTGNTRPGTGTPFGVGLAVSAEFVNYALFKVWDSGMLCLTVTSALSSQLSPGMLGPLLFPSSVNRFLFPLTPAQSYLGLAIRPQQPPSTTAENIPDPDEEGDEVFLVNVVLPELQLDFIFWTNDRYTRMATVQTDLTVNLTLDVVPGANGDELKLALGDIEFANTSVLNGSTLLSEGELDGDQMNSTLNSAAPLIAGGLAGSLPNIALEELINSALVLPGPPPQPLPLRIDFTGDSLIPFDEAGGRPFVGVFFNLAAAGGGGGLTQRPETSVEITSVTIPENHESFGPRSLGQGALPRVEIAMSAEAPEGAELEYSYRTAFTGWSPWSRSRYAVIEDPSLVLQQRHEVFARARIVGAENGTDFSSARAEFVVDVTPPAMQVTTAPNGTGELQAYDYVYGTDNLEYRVDGSEWRPLQGGVAQLGEIDDDTEIEVRDPSGNADSNQKLRGRGDPDAAAAGCGCATAGGTSGSSLPAALLSLAMLGVVTWRRRRR